VRSILRSVLATASLISLMFMTSTARQSAGPSESEDEQWKEYKAAVLDSATYEPDKLHPLFPLRYDRSTRIATVVTLTNYYYDEGPQTLSRDLWVTSVPEVQNKCRDFHHDLALRLRQLLGLQPETQIVWFVTMHVGITDIFRPTTDPSTTSACLCGGELTPFEGGSRFEETDRRKIDYTCRSFRTGFMTITRCGSPSRCFFPTRCFHSTIGAIAILGPGLGIRTIGTRMRGRSTMERLNT
jgi:hypothetical protein